MSLYLCKHPGPQSSQKRQYCKFHTMCATFPCVYMKMKGSSSHLSNTGTFHAPWSSESWAPDRRSVPKTTALMSWQSPISRFSCLKLPDPNICALSGCFTGTIFCKKKSHYQWNITDCKNCESVTITQFIPALVRPVNGHADQMIRFQLLSDSVPQWQISTRKKKIHEQIFKTIQSSTE